MKRQRIWLTAIMFAMVTSLSLPSFAKNNNRLLTDWSLVPDSDRPHPTERQMALIAPTGMTIVYCGFHYRHGRYRFDRVQGTNREPLTLNRGGRVTMSLEILRGEETIKVAKKKVKVKMVDERRAAAVGWADSSGATEDDGYYMQGRYSALMNFETSTVLPLQLKKGDVLLFSQKFKKMPKLEGVEITGAIVKWDEISVGAGCKTCGTTDHPCPEL